MQDQIKNHSRDQYLVRIIFDTFYQEFDIIQELSLVKGGPQTNPSFEASDVVTGEAPNGKSFFS